MDNDNKIINIEEQRHKDVLLFLQDELESLKVRNSGKSYNLEQEYAKTRKNRSPFVPLVLAGCIVGIGLISFLLTKSIEKKSREITINVAEFDDVNLKNLIDTVSRTQNQYEAAVKNKNQIESQKNSAMNAALDKRDSDIVTIQLMNFRDKSVRMKREEEVRKTYAEAVDAINAEYDPLLEAAELEVQSLLEKLNEYDSSKLEAVREQQKALDSQRQLQEIERKQIVDVYEERIAGLEKILESNRKVYQEEIRNSLISVSNKLQSEIDALDPVIEDDYAHSVVISPMVNDRMIHNPVESAAFSLEDEELSETLSEVKKMYEDYKYLDQKVQEIPYKFTIGDYVRTDSVLVDKVTETLADSLYNQYVQKVELQDELEAVKKEYENEIASLNRTHENEMSSLKNEYQKKLDLAQQEKDDQLYVVMQGAGFSSIISSAESKDSIYVYVRPNARYLISETKGCPAEIPFKKPIKGKVLRTEDGRFRFEPDRDKNGEYVDFDLSALVTGVQVKLK